MQSLGFYKKLYKKDQPADYTLRKEMSLKEMIPTLGNR